ncbi:MAG: hypothetical protein RJA76_654 [Bacteroidota bacterium]
MNRKIQNLLWYLVPVVIVITKWLRGGSAYNNYLVYKNVFWHSLHQKNLYLFYPADHFDQNLYGPIFAILIAPFALLPDWLGMICWIIFGMWVLSKGLSYFFKQNPPTLLFLFVWIEALTSVHNLQFNILLAGGLLWAYALVKQQNDWASSLIVMLLILTKIYGIVGLIFVFFSSSPRKFIIYSLGWCMLGLILPILLSSPIFVYQSYFHWYQAIVHKNELNQNSFSGVGMQDISAMGLIKRIFGIPDLSTLYFLIPAAIFSLLPLLRFKLHSNLDFQLKYFAQVMMGLVIFSSSSESSTYIIAICGFVIWQKDTFLQRPHLWLFIFAFIFTVLSPTDIFPPFIRKEFFVKYALKAFPILIAWIVISKQLICNSFKTNELFES